MSPSVSEEQILAALHGVPTDRWGEVLHLLGEMRAKPSAATESTILTAADLLQSGLVGIWADRTDLGDSADFARRLREKAERREGGAHAAGQ